MSRSTENSSFDDVFPEIAREWHPTRNGGLRPDAVAPKSNKNVWWKCRDAHEWRARVGHRANGSGCPYCSGRLVTPERNLLVSFPNVAKEWHPSRNGSLCPEEVLPGTAKKIWWRCAKGHEWQAAINSRTTPPAKGCPECARARIGPALRKRAVQARGSFADTFPDVLLEWHPTKNGDLVPTRVSSHSHAKAWWLCRFGHEWETTINNRTSLRRGCPFCKAQTSRLEVRIYVEFHKLFPRTTWRERINRVEADILVPELQLVVEVDGYPWHEGKEGKDRRKSDYFSTLGYHVIRVRDRQLSKSAGGIEIVVDTARDSMPTMLNLCRAIVKLRDINENDRVQVLGYIRDGRFIAETDYNKILSHLPAPTEEQSLLRTLPELASEWHLEKNAPLKPAMFTPYSHKNVWWRCDRGHEWKADIANRAQGRGCPVCSLASSGGRRRKAAREKFGTFFANRPHILTEWHTDKNALLNPVDFPPHSNSMVWWKCANGHEWKTAIAHRTRGRGCPVCAREVVGSKARLRAVARLGSLATKHPQLAAEWDIIRNGPLKPDEISPGSHFNAWWTCARGHSWQSEVRVRAKGVSCPTCTKHHGT